MFIDMHVHPDFFWPVCKDEATLEFRRSMLGIYKNGTPPLEHIHNQMNCAGLDKLCLLPQDHSATKEGPWLTNEDIAYLAGLEPDRFIGFASVDPMEEKAGEKLEDAFLRLGLKGLKLNPCKQKYYPADQRLAPLYDICEKYNRPVVFHSGLSWEPGTLAKYGRPIEFEQLACERPGLRFCLAHFGWPWVRETAMLMLKYKNVYADTAALHFDSAREFFIQTFTKDIPATWIDRSLRHQLMFGSNNPRFEQIRMAKALESIGLRPSTLELVRGKNALEFLNGAQEGTHA